MPKIDDVPRDERKNLFYAAIKVLKGGSRQMLDERLPDPARQDELLAWVHQQTGIGEARR